MATVENRYVQVLVFRRTVKGAEYLLLQRASTETIYPNLWQMVTGKIKNGERALDAARRELLEETQLTCKRLWIVPAANSFYDPAADVMEVLPLFAVEVEESVNPVLSKEHQQFSWALFDEAARLLVWPDNHRGLEIVEKYIVANAPVAHLSEVKLSHQ
ncbi:MAG: NUDIX domain-containing protein [Ignavibacteriales bacterium]|nr:NUDIX domain-containing protein [Ignavibacteriales bacterium]